MITLKEVAILDRNAELCGVPPARLMENAGRAVAREILERFPTTAGPVLIFCGSGNNGGDGLVAARYLSLSHKVLVVLMGSLEKIKTELARTAFASLEGLAKREENIELFFHHELDRATLISMVDGAGIIIDAMLGSGISGELREPYASTIHIIGTVCRGQKKQLVAVDVPTGWGQERFFDSTLLITFHDMKEGYEELAPRTVVVDIGIPPEAEVVMGQGHLLHLPPLLKSTRKGMRGKLLVVGGGPYTGAPVLAAHGASESGIDLIHLAVPRLIFSPTAAASADFIVHPLQKPDNHLAPQHLNQLMALIQQMDAVVLGPGLGRSPESCQTVLALLCADREKEHLRMEGPVPCVLDADALFALAQELPGFLSKRAGCEKLLLDPLILSPHEGEFRRLLKARGMRLSEAHIKEACQGPEFRVSLPGHELRERIAETKLLARKLGAVVLRKGQVDIISDGWDTRLNTTGTPAMAVGGTGDVLSGLCGGLMAQGLKPLVAASLGAYLNGKAGELATELKGRSMKATDLVKALHRAINQEP